MKLIMAPINWIKDKILEYFLSRCQNKVERKVDFHEKQLRELYSPLVSTRKEIQILSEFRCEAEKASEKWWKGVCKQGEQMAPGEAQKYYDEKGKGISSQIEYENEQLRKKIIPAYNRMIEIFKNNFGLAEKETKEYFPILVKFVETWERHLSRSHPREVIREIQVSEQELMPFYLHIEEMLEALQKKIK